MHDALVARSFALKTAPSGADNTVDLTAADANIGQCLIGQSTQLNFGAHQFAVLEIGCEKALDLIRNLMENV